MAKRYPNVIVNRKGLDKLIGKMKALDGLESRVGWFSGQNYGPENQNLPIAQVAQWQEEGVAGGQGNGSGIPSRPFIRSFFIGLKKSAPFKTYVANELRLYLAGQKTSRAVAKTLGEFIRQGLQETIIKWTYIRNADSTIAKKGRNDPLVDTGLMARSITIKIMREVKVKSR